MLGIESDPVHERADRLTHTTGRIHTLDVEGCRDDGPDSLTGVERVVRILEDHLRLLAHRPHSPAREVRDIRAIDDDPARGRCQQPQDGATRRGLATAALTDETQCLCGSYVQTHAIDGLDLAHRAREDTTRLGREVDAEVLDLKDAIRHETPPWPR